MSKAQEQKLGTCDLQQIALHPFYERPIHACVNWRESAQPSQQCSCGIGGDQSSRHNPDCCKYISQGAAAQPEAGEPRQPGGDWDKTQFRPVDPKDYSGVATGDENQCAAPAEAGEPRTIDELAQAEMADGLYDRSAKGLSQCPEFASDIAAKGAGALNTGPTTSAEPRTAEQLAEEFLDAYDIVDDEGAALQQLASKYCPAGGSILAAMFEAFARQVRQGDAERIEAMIHWGKIVLLVAVGPIGFALGFVLGLLWRKFR